MPPVLPAASGQSPRELLPSGGKAYLVRVLFVAMALAMVGVDDAVCDARPWAHGGLLLAGLVYPHLGHLLLGRSQGRRRGQAIFIVDGLFSGAAIAALDLALVPGAVLAAINLFNWMSVGGGALTALGLIALLIGMAPLPALMLPAPGCAPLDALACAVLIAYVLIVAALIHRHVATLRRQQIEFQARADAAREASALAERALLAVLPPCAARLLAPGGETSIPLADATVLLLELDWDRSPTAAALTDVLAVCDTILARHGFESMKTLGHRLLAMSQAGNGPDAAIAAAREIETHLADHAPDRARDPGTRCQVRTLVHRGPVTLALVQPERLNIEILGPTVDALFLLAGAGPAHVHPTPDTPGAPP